MKKKKKTATPALVLSSTMKLTLTELNKDSEAFKLHLNYNDIMFVTEVDLDEPPSNYGD